MLLNCLLLFIILALVLRAVSLPLSICCVEQTLPQEVSQAKENVGVRQDQQVLPERLHHYRIFVDLHSIRDLKDKRMGMFSHTREFILTEHCCVLVFGQTD
jgi:hypothetical protein